jgi:hypothetical protein
LSPGAAWVNIWFSQSRVPASNESGDIYNNRQSPAKSRGHSPNVG